MSQEFREGDVIDIVFRRAVVLGVYDNGRMHVMHSNEEMRHFDPHAADVEVTVVDYSQDVVQKGGW